MDPIFSAVFISEISAKMFLANQIAAFLIKHISRKIICMWVKIHIKFFGWEWSKMAAAGLVNKINDNPKRFILYPIFR